MKFVAQLASLVTIMAFAGSALAVTCGSTQTTSASDLQALRNDLGNNGQNYRLSGRGNSQFDQVGSARLKMRRTSGIPTGSTHVTASIAGQVVQDIINQCCDDGATFCCGNGDITGDQGDKVNVNIDCRR